MVKEEEEMEDKKMEENYENRKQISQFVKDRIILFALGVFVGVVVSTGTFVTVCVVAGSNSNYKEVQMQERGNEIPNRQFEEQGEGEKHYRKSKSNMTTEEQAAEKDVSNTKTES